MPIYLQRFIGLSVSDSGLGLLGLLLGTVAGATISGRLVAHILHYKRIALVGAVLAAACLAAFGLVAHSASLLVVELLSAGAGFGTGMTFPIATIAVQNAVDRAHLGVATGVLTFLRALGGALGVAAFGAIALGYGMLGHGDTVAVGSVEAARPFAAMFLAAAVIMLAALVCLVLMHEKPLLGAAERAAEPGS
jgi:MFS family permease